MTDTRPGDDTLAVDDRRDLLLAWAASADAFDEIALSELLVEASDAPPRDVAGVRARMAVTAGQPGRALEQLALLDVVETSPDGPRSMDDVVLLAAKAQQGDRTAFSALVAASSVVGSAGRLTYLVLLASAAEHVGQRRMADQVWGSLVSGGAVTQLTMSRFVAGHVAARHTENADLAASSVFEAALALQDAWPRPWDDPSTLESAVAVLEARGDRAGAALLAAAVARTSPPDPRLRDAVDRLRPATRRAALVVPWLVWIGCVVAGQLAGMAAGAWIFRTLRRTWRVAPELGAADEKVWFGIRQLRYDVVRRAPRQSSTRPAHVLGALLGLVVGSAVAGVASSALHSSFDSLADVLTFATPLVVGPVVGVVVAERARRRSELRTLRRQRDEQEAERRRALAGCRCGEGGGLVGLSADEYAHGHLRPDPAEAPPLLGSSARILRCDVSGMRWLSTRTGSGFSALLLRGTAPAGRAAGADAPTGLYL